MHHARGNKATGPLRALRRLMQVTFVSAEGLVCGRRGWRSPWSIDLVVTAQPRPENIGGGRVRDLTVSRKNTAGTRRGMLVRGMVRDRLCCFASPAIRRFAERMLLALGTDIDLDVYAAELRERQAIEDGRGGTL